MHFERSYISRSRGGIKTSHCFLEPDSLSFLSNESQEKYEEEKVAVIGGGMFIIGSNAVCNVLIVSVIREKCIIARTCDAQAARGFSGLFACVYIAVNITQRLRRSYKIGECAAKYRLSFTKIKYSEHNKSARRIL